MDHRCVAGHQSKVNSYANNLSEAVEVKRGSVATEVIDYTDYVAKKAHDLAVLVSGRLSSVVLPEIEGSASDVSAKTQREYPPLYAELRNSLQRIDSSLRQIEDMVQRAEL